MRKTLGLESGDTVFVMLCSGGLLIQKAINPFDALVDEAIKEYRRENQRSGNGCSGTGN